MALTVPVSALRDKHPHAHHAYVNPPAPINKDGIFPIKVSTEDGYSRAIIIRLFPFGCSGCPDGSRL